jgi:Ca2+/H+ antiporter, TMEM165/GDT1 family
LNGLLSSFFFIFLAEMGDKTQLVALSLSTKFNPWKVVAGIFIGTLVSHLMAGIIGQNLSLIIPLRYLKILVGMSFIVFGFWTFKGDTYNEKKEKKVSKFGPIITIAVVFFLAELGDKTQLATISLAARYHTLLGVLAGSTLGMVCADGLAIVLGTLAGKRLPEKTIKYFSAAIFIVFGLVILIEALKR